MSTLKAANKARVIVTSALEERLKKLPKGELPSEQIEKSLKGPVQKLEVEQSGVAEKLRVSKTYDPAKLLEDLENRRDVWNIREFRGTPIKDKTISDYQPPQNLHEEWRDLRNSIIDYDEVGETTSIKSIDEFISFKQNELDNFATNPRREAWMDDEYVELQKKYAKKDIDRAEKLKEAMTADMTEQYNIDKFNVDDFNNFQTLLDEAGMDIHVNDLTRENLDTVIYRFEELKMNANSSYQADQFDDLLNRAHILKEQLQRPIPPSTVAAFPNSANRWNIMLEDNSYDAMDFTSENLDTFIETQKHEIDALVEDGAHLNELAINELEDEIAEAVSMKADLDNYTAGNTRYIFDDNMDTAILPDTDMASYAVRVYENPTVDTKGLSYTNIGHIPEGQFGVFHTRTDSPKAYAHRIIEIQSDIQNTLTKKRANVVRAWKEGPKAPDMTFPIVGNKAGGVNTMTSYGPNSPEIVKLRGRVNNKVLAELEENGARINIDYPADHFDNASISDLRNALVEEIAPSTTDFALRGDYSAGTSIFLRRLGAGKVGEYDSIPLRVKEELGGNGLSVTRMEDIVEGVKDLDSIYKRHLHRERGLQLLANEDAAKYKVTLKERKTRIVLGKGISKEEGELNANAVVETLQEVSKKYGKEFKPYPGAKQQYDTRAIIVEEALSKETIEDVTQYMKAVHPTTTKKDVMNLLTAPRYSESLVKAVPELKDIAKMVDDANKIFSKKIDEGMKSLKPLEQFPNNKDFKLGVPWMKQGIQEEVVQAINKGQKEIWLTVDPEGLASLGRTAGVQRNYEKGGDMYNTFKSVARRFDAEVIEEDGYLKMMLPDGPKPRNKKVKVAAGAASAFVVNSYADTNTEDWVNEQLKNNAPPDQIAAYLAKKSVPETEESLWEEQMLKNGAEQEQIDAYKQKRFAQEINGMDPADFAKHEGARSDDTKAPQVNQYQVQDDLTYRGPNYKELTPETIKEIAIELEVDPSTPSGIDAIYQEAFWKENPEKYAEYQAEINADVLRLSDITPEVADYINLRDSWKIFSFVASLSNIDVATVWRSQKEKELTAWAIEKGNEAGLKLEFGKGQKIGDQTLQVDEWYVQLPHPETGELRYWPATPSMLQSMAGEKYMDVGALIGAIHGAQQAGKMTRWVNGIPHPPTRWTRYAVIGGWTIAGAVTGSMVDQAEVEIRQQEDFNWQTSLDRAVGAAELAIVGEVFGHAIGWAGKGVAKQLLKGYNLLIDGNIEGAFDMLSKMTGLTETEIKEVVKRWERLNMKDAPVLERAWYSPRRYVKTARKKAKEQAIAVVPISRFGGDEIVRGISNKNPGAGAVIGNDIHARAQMMGKIARENMSIHGKKHTVEELLEAIPKWVEETETNLAQVKQAGNDLTPPGYSVRSTQTTLPKYKSKVKAIKYEPGYGFDMKEDYINQLYDGSIPGADNIPIANKLERLNLNSDDRSFAGLLDFRDKIQEYYNDPRHAKGTRKALDNMLKSIDGEIEAVSQRMGPGGEQWLDNYWSAMMDATEMRELQKTGLYRTLTRKEGSKYYNTPLDEDKVANTLIKYGRSLDGSYQAFVKQLPLEIQPKVEALVMDKLIEKYTFNKGIGFEAIMFPQLAEELGNFEFLWPEAKAVREIAEQFGEVYKNDVRLSVAARGAITEDAFTSYLTTNPITRAQFAIASTVFNKASTMAGTARGDASALTRIATRLLKNPLDPTNVEHALEAAKGDAALTGALKRLSIHAAEDKHAGRVDVKIPLFKDKSGKLSAKGGPGRTKTAESIPAHRVAAEEIASKIVKSKDFDDLSKLDRAMLLNKGYVAIGLNDGTVIKLN